MWEKIFQMEEDIINLMSKKIYLVGKVVGVINLVLEKMSWSEYSVNNLVSDKIFRSKNSIIVVAKGAMPGFHSGIRHLAMSRRLAFWLGWPSPTARNQHQFFRDDYSGHAILFNRKHRILQACGWQHFKFSFATSQFFLNFHSIFLFLSYFSTNFPWKMLARLNFFRFLFFFFWRDNVICYG